MEMIKGMEELLGEKRLKGTCQLRDVRLLRVYRIRKMVEKMNADILCTKSCSSNIRGHSSKVADTVPLTDLLKQIAFKQIEEFA